MKATKRLWGRIGQIVRGNGDEVIDSEIARRPMVFRGSGLSRQSLKEAAIADDGNQQGLDGMALEVRDDSRTGGRGGGPLWAERSPRRDFDVGPQSDTIISLVAALLVGALIVFTQR
jgi:hypothetical protein